MTTLFTFLILIALGFSIMKSISKEFSIFEKLGIGILLGFGIATILMYVFTLTGIPINTFTILSVFLLGIVALNYNNLSINKLLKNPLTSADKIEFTFAWFFLAGLSIFFLYGVFAKGLFWPPAEYDSLTGYDLFAKMIANEGTLKASIYEYYRFSVYDVIRFTYPPFTAGSFALAYMSGEESSKISMIVMYAGFIFGFYGLVRRALRDTWAILLTFIVMVTPEMFSHVSLSLSNLPNAICSSLSLLCLYYWLIEREKRYYIISLLLMILTLWSRSDSVIYLAAAGLVFAIDFIKNKEWKMPLIYGAISIIPFVAWTLFVKYHIHADTSIFFMQGLSWDNVKFSTVMGKCLRIVLGNGLYYGITFYVFLVIMALNTVDIFITRHPMILMIISSWVMYTFVYYQFNYDFAGSMDVILNASYKRGMFNFVPLCWFFVFTSPMTTRWRLKLENFLFK